MAIYLMMDRDCVKVGFATDVKKRMSGYRTHNPHCECIDFNEECSRIDEEVIHELMNNDTRFTRCNTTEWYQVNNEELLKTIQMEKLNYFLKMVGIEENSDELIPATVMKAYTKRTPLSQYLISEGNIRITEAKTKGYSSCVIMLDGTVDRLHHLSRRGVCEFAINFFKEKGYSASAYSTNRKIQVRW